MAGPPIAAGVSPTAGAAGMLGQPAGAGAEAVQAQLQQTAASVRQIGDLLQQLGAANPTLAPDIQQVSQILKGMIVKVAQSAPAQTASSLAVPGSGGGA